jgi:hypothetical protein
MRRRRRVAAQVATDTPQSVIVDSWFGPAQDRVWIDSVAFPQFLRIVWIFHGQDRKMQMVIAGARVAGVADISDDISLPHVIAHTEAVCVVVEVRVIKDQLLIVAQLINYLAAESVATDPDHLAAGGGQHRSPARNHNVYCAMDSSPGTRRAERVVQIILTPARDRNNQIR